MGRTLKVELSRTPCTGHLESPHNVSVNYIANLRSTPPVLVPIPRRTARIVVRVPPMMSSGLSASIAAVESMSESMFCRRFRSSYERSPSLSPPNLPLRKHYQEDEGSTVEDEDPAVGDEGLAAEVEGPSTDDESYSLDAEIRGLYDEGHSVESDGLGLEEEWEAVPEDQQQALQLLMDLPQSPRDLSGSVRHLDSHMLYHMTRPVEGMVYIDVPTYPPPAPPVQTPPSPEWTSSSLPISPSPSVLPSPASSPMIPLTAPSPVALPATAETEGFLTKLGAQVQMQRGLIHDHAVGAVREEIFFKRYKFRSIKYEQEWVTVTFGAIWRQVLALESWVGQTDAQRETLWHAISDMQGDNLDLLV
ncbi:hypothetical protein Tco_0938082 [Tanacetum coccineum]|uniref:Uncharacterized protein n=1 Tax=Tanacetum coccineum TaxID=301880 RepID=A0ABQ5DGV6_9ASTR